jgi:toxin ParE1/3/4
MKVRWTGTAEAHLDAIFRHISRDSPEYAKRMVDRLTRRSQQISGFPISGRRVPEYDIDQIREVFEDSYRIIYHIKPDQIDVLAVIHGAMNLLPPPPNENPDPKKT